MQITTCQMAKTAELRREGWTVLDITVMSGIKAFAPTWKMVRGHKAGTVSDEEYTDQYLSMMRTSFRKWNDEWMKLLKIERLALACYCRMGNFCHRHILADCIEKFARSKGIEVEQIWEGNVDEEPDFERKK
jgi:uncharacterized protein (DUF488 family)